MLIRIKALLMTLILFLFAGCRVYDGPPSEPDTPEPPAHTGTFVSDYGTMTFTGDGKTVTLSVTKELAALTKLPEGEYEAAYAFKANTPPHVYEYRYDLANEMHLTVDGENYVLYSGPNAFAEEQLRFYAVDGDGKTVYIEFNKEKQ